jgi:hypothetical protein
MDVFYAFFAVGRKAADYLHRARQRRKPAGPRGLLRFARNDANFRTVIARSEATRQSRDVVI